MCEDALHRRYGESINQHYKIVIYDVILYESTRKVAPPLPAAARLSMIYSWAPTSAINSAHGMRNGRVPKSKRFIIG